MDLIHDIAVFIAIFASGMLVGYLLKVFLLNWKSKNKNKYLHGFAKTNDSLGKKLRFVTENKKQNKDDFMEQLMVTLIEADIGYQTSELICDKFFETCQNYYYLFAKDIMNFLGQTFREVYYEKPDTEIVYNENGPTVILMVGVNGSGKTSTCAKLAYRYLQEGKTTDALGCYKIAGDSKEIFALLEQTAESHGQTKGHVNTDGVLASQKHYHKSDGNDAEVLQHLE